MTLRPILTRRKLTLLALVAVAVVAAFLIVGQLRAAHGVASGGSPAARALLERELARLPDNHIVSAEFTSPRPDEIATGAPNKSDNWLNIDARAASHADAIVADWQAALLLAAFSQSAQTAGVNRLDGAQLQIRDGSGQIIDRNDFDLGDPALAAPDIIETDHAAAEARMRTSFENGAASANARLVRATFVELPDLSADVTVSTADPASFVSHSGVELAKIFGGERGLNGRLIRVIDAAGNPVMYASFTHRLNSGSAWIAPKHENVSDSFGKPLVKP